MNTKEYPEILLVRFTKAQRAFIRGVSKKRRTPEAQVVRNAIDLIIAAKKNSDANRK